MEAPSRPAARRTLTPAVLVAALFATACAGVSIAFVAAHGGLEVPGAPGGSGPVALDSPSAEPGRSDGPAATLVPAPTASSTNPLSTPESSVPPAASVGPSVAPPATAVPSIDPLTALPGCPGHPGCYEYTIRRGDSLSTIGDRWLIGTWILEALNPQVTDPSTIVVGQVLYLGRSPVVRLDACADTPHCYLYVVRAGDRLSVIAGRYGTTTSAILAFNPSISNANQIRTGQVIRLPGP